MSAFAAAVLADSDHAICHLLVADDEGDGGLDLASADFLVDLSVAVIDFDAQAEVKHLLARVALSLLSVIGRMRACTERARSGKRGEVLDEDATTKRA